MRYFAKLKGQKEAAPIDIKPVGPGHFTVKVGEKQYDVDALTLDHGAVSMIIDGESFGVEFDEGAEEVAVLLRGHIARVDIASERQLRMRAASAQFSAEGKQLIAAPMPGKVVKVLVKVGDDVQQNQGLVVVEAMKMENELKSPKAGKVTELFCKEGQTVENGAKLVVVE